MTALGYFPLGLIAGAVYFATLRWNTTLYATRGIALAAGTQFLRFAALGLILAAIAHRGPMPLLLAALGVVIARPLMVRLLP